MKYKMTSQAPTSLIYLGVRLFIDEKGEAHSVLHDRAVEYPIQVDRYPEASTVANPAQFGGVLMGRFVAALRTCSRLDLFQDAVAGVLTHAHRRNYPRRLAHSTWTRFLVRYFDCSSVTVKELRRWFHQAWQHIVSGSTTPTSNGLREPLAAIHGKRVQKLAPNQWPTVLQGIEGNELALTQSSQSTEQMLTRLPALFPSAAEDIQEISSVSWGKRRVSRVDRSLAEQFTTTFLSSPMASSSSSSHQTSMSGSPANPLPQCAGSVAHLAHHDSPIPSAQTGHEVGPSTSATALGPAVDPPTNPGLAPLVADSAPLDMCLESTPADSPAVGPPAQCGTTEAITNVTCEQSQQSRAQPQLHGKCNRAPMTEDDPMDAQNTSCVRSILRPEDSS